MDQLVKNAEHVDFVNVSVQEWIKTLFNIVVMLSESIRQV